MQVRKRALITVDLVHQNGKIPKENESDFKEWLIYKGKELGAGWHHEYYALDENHLNDIHIKMLVTITFAD